MRNTRTISTALTLMACLTVASTAYADDPREQQAEPIYREGVKLHDKGQEAEALERFRQSYAVYPSPVALNAIARSELLLGRDLEAVRHFRQVLANPLTHPQTAQKARESVQELEARLGRIKVQAPEGTVFIIDGERHVAPVAVPIDVRPGEIRVEGTYGDARYEGVATAARGTTVPLELKKVTSTQSAVGEQPPPAGSEQSFWDTGRVIGVAALGVGVVGIGLGLVFNSSSNSDATRGNDLQKQLGPGGCSGGASTTGCADLNDARDGQSRNATLSTVFLVAGAAIGATGAVLMVWPRSNVQLAPSAGPRGAGLSLTGTF